MKKNAVYLFRLTCVPRPGIDELAVEELPAEHGGGVQTLAPIGAVTVPPDGRRSAVRGHRVVAGPPAVVLDLRPGPVRQPEHVHQVPHGSAGGRNSRAGRWAITGGSGRRAARTVWVGRVGDAVTTTVPGPA